MNPARAYVSSCLLDTTTAFLPVSVRAIEESLRSFPGARLETSHAGPSSEHPVWLEFARIREGRLEQQNEWARRMGAVFGPAAGAFAGAWNAGVSAALGTYHEVMIGVPDVHLVGRRGGPFMLVLGMYTDSPTAKWGDEVLRCGYRKRMADLSRTGLEDYVVKARDGGALLRMTARAEQAWTRATTLAELEPFEKRLEQPLLGYLGGREYAVTSLERRYFADVVGRPVEGEVEVVQIEGSASLLTPGRHPLVARVTSGYGALQLAGVAAKLTYPEHFVVAST